jgi:hypothetical protein
MPFKRALNFLGILYPPNFGWLGRNCAKRQNSFRWNRSEQRRLRQMKAVPATAIPPNPECRRADNFGPASGDLLPE